MKKKKKCLYANASLWMVCVFVCVVLLSVMCGLEQRGGGWWSSPEQLQQTEEKPATPADEQSGCVLLFCFISE